MLLPQIYTIQLSYAMLCRYSSGERQKSSGERQNGGRDV